MRSRCCLWRESGDKLLAIAVISLAALFSLLLPIPGFAAYILAITLGSQLAHKFGLDSSVISLSDVLLVGPLIRFSWPAISRVFRGRSRVPGALYVLSWGLACVILAAAVVAGPMDRRALHQFILFGPFLLALLQLEDVQREQVMLCIIGVAGAIGLIAALVSVTDNAWLSSLLFVRLQAVTAEDYTDTSNARVILPGIWTVAPFGFWLALGLFVKGKLKRTTRFFIVGAAAAILLGLAVNYSRSVAIPYLAGLGAMSVAALLSRDKTAAKRSGLVIACVLVLVAGNLILRPGVRQNWSERFFGNQRYGTVKARVNASQMLADAMQSEGELLGRSSAQFRNFTTAGDPLSPLTAWHNFGYAGMVAYILLVLAILAKAFNVMYDGVFRVRGPTIASIVTYGYLFYFLGGIFSGFYFSEDMIVPVVFWMWVLCMRESTAATLAGQPELPSPEGEPAQVSP
jgi:hypothetical protein